MTRFPDSFNATDGYPHLGDGTPRIEDVAGNWAAINDEAGYYVPDRTLGWPARYMFHLFGKEADD